MEILLNFRCVAPFLIAGDTKGTAGLAEDRCHTVVSFPSPSRLTVIGELGELSQYFNVSPTL